MGVLPYQRLVLEPCFGLPYGYLDIEVEETSWLRGIQKRDWAVLRQPYYVDSSASSPSDTVEGGSEKEKTNQGSNDKEDVGGENDNSDDDAADEEVSGSDGEGGDGAGDDDDDDSEDDEEFDVDTEDDDEDTDPEDSDLDEEEEDETGDVQELVKDGIKKVSSPEAENAADTTDGINGSGAVDISGEKSISVTAAAEKRKIEEVGGDASDGALSSDANAKKQKLDD